MRRSLPEESRRRVGVVAKILGLLVAFVLFVSFAGPVSRFFGNFMADRLEESLPDLPSPPTAPDTTSPGATATTFVLVEAPPTLNLECPSAGQGWVATMVATQYLQDPVGYHTWYRIGGAGLWVYRGVFRSGLDGPAPLEGIASAVQVGLRYDRLATIDPEMSEGYASFMTGADC